MVDHRLSFRKQMFVYFDVLTADTHTLYGRLIDISSTGLRLMSKTPKAVGEEKKVLIDATSSEFIDEPIPVDIVCVWTRPGPTPDIFDAGFKFKDNDMEKLRDVYRIMELYSFMNEY